MPLCYSLLLSGLPGNMAMEVLHAALECSEVDRPRICDQALVAQDGKGSLSAGGVCLKPLGPGERCAAEIPADAIAIDFTWPESAIPNMEFYVSRGIPFVMGTTGFDMDLARSVVAAGNTPCVIAPNMAAPIVLIQTAFAHLAERFPGALADYSISVRESHQAAKKDTSGTAKAIVSDLSRLGLRVTTDDIQRVRDADVQRTELNVPEEHIDGHAWHFYEAASADRHTRIGFSHCIEGRRVYAEGALQAWEFLSRQVGKGSEPKIYTMTDVLADIRRTSNH